MQELPWRSLHKLNLVDVTHFEVHRDGANAAGGQYKQAMGRTKGGLNTRLHALILTAGQEADVSHAPPLLERAHDSDALRDLIAAKGMKACIPPRSNRKAPADHDVELYKKRKLPFAWSGRAWSGYRTKLSSAI